jgi:putative hemolysin
MVGIEVLIILLLMIANGLFAAAELAIISARRGRLAALAESGHRAAQQALTLATNPERLLAAVQVGITLIGTFAAAFGGARLGDALAGQLRTINWIAPYAESVALGVVVALLTYLNLVLGELAPKRLALQHAEAVALAAAPLMAAIARIGQPIVALLAGSANLVLRLLGQQPTEQPPVTEDDITYMVRLGAASGTVAADEAQVIRQVFRMTDRPIRAVMTPRTEITAVAITDSWEAVLQTFVQSEYSRLPVYEDNLDNIVGVVHAKDLLHSLAAGAGPVDLKMLLHPPTFVFEAQHVGEVLPLLQRQRAHLAIVLDEYGQVAGLITLEDLLEELVGEIEDEYDQPEEAPFVQREDGSWLIDGLEAYDRVQEKLGLPPQPEEERADYTTLAGWMVARLGRMPQVGDTITTEQHIVEVVDMDGRRIDKVLIRPRPPTPPTPTGNPEAGMPPQHEQLDGG